MFQNQTAFHFIAHALIPLAEFWQGKVTRAGDNQFKYTKLHHHTCSILSWSQFLPNSDPFNTRLQSLIWLVLSTLFTLEIILQLPTGVLRLSQRNSCRVNLQVWSLCILIIVYCNNVYYCPVIIISIKWLLLLVVLLSYQKIIFALWEDYSFKCIEN